MILRARTVLPMQSPALDNGAVLIERDRIRAVGHWRDLATTRSSVIDLGEVILLPGLINAHCHLDYTHMAGQLQSPKAFIDWLKLITTTKAQWTAEEYRASWCEGADMLVRSGTTTVADIEAVPQLLPDAWQRTPLRVISFLEMIGITQRRLPEQVLQEAVKKLESLTHNRCCVGLSPHAPYSTVPELMRKTAAFARKHRLPVCTHIAESQTEFTMFAHAKGDMYDWLKKSGREMSDCGYGSPVRHLDRCGILGANLLAIHVNYLARGDAKLLAQRKVNVIHCPRSHAYFEHQAFPLRRLMRAGVNVCLGTDSLASVVKTRRQSVELDMLAEMRVLADRHSWLNPKRILQMATLNGARALGRNKVLGELNRGAMADVIALPIVPKRKSLYEAILQHRGRVAASMIGGDWAVAPQ